MACCCQSNQKNQNLIKLIACLYPSSTVLRGFTVVKFVMIIDNILKLTRRAFAFITEFINLSALAAIHARTRITRDVLAFAILPRVTFITYASATKNGIKSINIRY